MTMPLSPKSRFACPPGIGRSRQGLATAPIDLNGSGPPTPSGADVLKRGQKWPPPRRRKSKSHQLKVRHGILLPVMFQWKECSPLWDLRLDQGQGRLDRRGISGMYRVMENQPFYVREGIRCVPGYWPWPLGDQVPAWSGCHWPVRPWAGEAFGSEDFTPARLTVDMYKLPGFEPVESKPP